MVDQTEIEARAKEARAWYGSYMFKCQLFREKFETYLGREIDRAGLVDARVESRAKGIDSFVQKAVTLDASGEFKYSDPVREITDLVGVRVMVPLSTDIMPVAQLMNETFDVEEQIERGAEDAHLDIPGYRSLHLVVRLKPEAARDRELAPFADMVVEIQVRTILQHAWAMLQHDVMYKAERPASPVVKRRLVALAGLLELADREFVQVRQVHAEVRDAPPRKTERPEDKLTATALRHFTETVFAEEDGAAHDWFVELKVVTDSLNLGTIGHLESALQEWLPRAQLVAETVRRRQPWLNTALLMDVLLRLAAAERYFDARPPTEADGYESDQVDEARRTFLVELDELRRALVSDD